MIYLMAVIIGVLFAGFIVFGALGLISLCTPIPKKKVWLCNECGGDLSRKGSGLNMSDYCSTCAINYVRMGHGMTYHTKPNGARGLCAELRHEMRKA